MLCGDGVMQFASAGYLSVNIKDFNIYFKPFHKIYIVFN